MNIVIKKAVSQDLDAVEGLYGAMCDYLADKPFNPNFRRGGYPTRENAAEYLAADGLYIAWADGAAVGSIALTASPSAEEDQPGEGGILYVHMVADKVRIDKIAGRRSPEPSAAGRRLGNAGSHHGGSVETRRRRPSALRLGEQRPGDSYL